MLPEKWIVQKRDSSLTPFDNNKIVVAINKASTAVYKKPLIQDKCEHVLQYVNAHCTPITAFAKILAVEDIQDNVEKALMLTAPEVSKAYILYRKEKQDKRKDVKSYLESKIPDDIQTPWGPIGYITFKRTYARVKSISNNGNIITESFRDTILRVLGAAQTQLRVGFTTEELCNAYTYMMSLKGLPSGRFLWQLGTETVDNYGLMSLQNCAFVRIDEPIRPFTWIFDVLMLGTGVGASIERRHVSQLPPIKAPINGTEILVTRADTKDADFIVPDSRAGWVSLLERVLIAFFVDGKSFSYSTILIRNKGAKIKGFGGTASGPEDLCKGISEIANILQCRYMKKLSSVDCLDIINIIGSIVVAGNIRRSALLVIGDMDDIEYLHAKRWDLGGIPNWRAMSNNSVSCANTSDLPSEFWDGYMGLGEPYGLINPTLSRQFGRLQDGDTYPDPKAEGANPCGEQTLCNYETCCLADIFLPNIENMKELQNVANILYRICKHSMALKCHHAQTENVVHENMRMGIGVTGYLQATEQQRSWLPQLYSYLREYDELYSKVHGFPVSIKLTTTKPSGTLSLLPNVTPGVHPAIYQYYIRRIRISTSNPLVELCRKNGYNIEFQRGFDGEIDQNTSIVSFPCSYPDGTILAKDLSAIQQLQYVLRLQSEWSDNAVSCTVYYRKEELSDIRAFLDANYSTNMKGCSFLLHNEHGFAQAPYEEITREEYNEMIKQTKPILEGVIAQEDDDSTECSSGGCPLK